MQNQKRNELILGLALVALFVLLGAAVMTLAPAAENWVAERKQVSEQTPLRLLVTSSDRRKMENGDDVVMLEGRILNPTDQRLPVPRLTAQLRSHEGGVVHQWIIYPPVAHLDAHASADFRSAEPNVPPRGDQLTVTIGPPTN